MRFKFFHLIVFIVAVVTLFSCTRLPIYKIRHISNQEVEFSPLTTYYDKKENVNVGISDDKDNLYIQAVFHNREHLMKIMRGGLMVYFDPEGKKGKEYHLKIERSENQKSNYGLPNPQMGNDRDTRQQSLSTVIATTFNKVTWDKAGKEFVFYRNLLKDPIDVELGPNKNNEFQLDIKIPQRELPFSKDQKLFSFGIESGTPSTVKKESGMQSNGMRGGGMQPGGRPGGGGRRGAGMAGGGGAPSGSSSFSGMNPIQIWFQVQL